MFTAVAEEAGRLLHARSAATIRYEKGYAVTVGRWADDDLGGFEIGTGVPLAGSEGLTAIVARTGAPARIEDYTDVRGHAADLMRERGYRSAVAAPIVASGGRGACCWWRPRGRWARTPNTGWPGSPSSSRWRWRAPRRARS